MIDVNAFEGDVTVHVTGDLDEVTLPSFSAVFAGPPEIRPGTNVLVDLRSCSYINSEGISLMVKLSRTFGDGFKVVVGMSGAVHKIFDICGFLNTNTFVRVDSGAPGAPVGP